MQIEVDKNICLQLLNISHATEMIQLVNENREYLRQWLPWVDSMLTINDAKMNIEDCAFKVAAKTDFAFAIIFNQKMGGRIGIHRINLTNKIGEIGYWLANGLQGNGIIAKSCTALISYGFTNLDLNRIEIRCATGNIKSKYVAEKLKFNLEAVMRQADRLNGEFVDLYLFAMLKKDWTPTQVRINI